MYLVDKEIAYLAKQGMLTPFVDYLVESTGRPSYGLSSCGYDVRLAPEWKTFKNIDIVRDMSDTNKEAWFDYLEAPSYTIPPLGFVLARTLEYVKLPDDVMATLYCKSSLARCGVVLPPTVIEPGWEGNIVVETFNQSPVPITIHAKDGIGQLLFSGLSTTPARPYDSSRKYHKQTGIIVAK